jgi:hypothetical protein
MDIVSESIESTELEQIEATVELPAIEELPPKAKAKAKAKPRARAVRPEPEPLPIEEVPVIAAPKAKARKPAAALKPAAAPAAAPVPAAPGISDVLGMLATALLDQRQQRNAQRSAMYQAFLE